MDRNANKDVNHFWKQYFSDLQSAKYHLVWLKVGEAVSKKRCKKSKTSKS